MTASLLKAIGNLSSGLVLEEILKQITDLLPGPITPQKITGIDKPVFNVNRFADRQYGKLLLTVLKNISAQQNKSWCENLNLIRLLKRLCIVESGNMLMLHDSIFALSEHAKLYKPSRELDVTISILEDLIKSDSLCSAVLGLCFQTNNDDLVFDSMSQQWTETIQLLVSLPNRVANILQGKVTDIFIPEFYVKILLCHVLKCIVSIYKMKAIFGIEANIKPLSTLLSKIFANFKTTTSFLYFIKIIQLWCNETTVISEIVQDLFFNLESQSVEAGALIVLKHSYEGYVFCLLGECILKSDIWKYVLCKKIPLLSLCSDRIILINLISYLGELQMKSQGNNIVLVDFILQLLPVWSDNSALLHTPYEQHLYISKLIVLGMNYLINIAFREEDVSTAIKNLIQSKLFSGMPAHLECTNENVRTVGMKTAECLVKDLNKLEKSEDKKIGLDFEYREECMKIVHTIDEYHSYCFERKVIDEETGDCLMEKLLVESGIYRNRSRPDILSDVNRNDSLKIKNNCAVEVNQQSRNESDGNSETEKHLSDNSELDSDDDFEPYDTSNDVKLAVTKRPKYLRDVKEGLLEQKDVDVWVGSLEILEELVYSQLPYDDVLLGTELLNILLNLEKRFYCENFDKLRFAGSLAIVIVNPEPSAEYLCQQFHEDIGKYAISQRLLILDLLSGGAKVLSAPCVDKNQSDEQKLRTINKNSPQWQMVVQQRIDNHTRRFCQPKRPLPKGSQNKFSKVAGSFLFPLLRGCGKTTPGLMYRVNSVTSYTQEECMLLLVHFLKTCAVILMSAINIPVATRMGHELLEATWNLRFHSEAKVREAVIACLASVVIAIPKSRLISDLFDELIEARLWLEACATSQGIIGNKTCEVDTDCRAFAAQVALLITNVLGNSD